MNTAQFIDRVFRRVGRGKPQAEIGIYRNAIQSIMGQALQRMGDRIAKDKYSYTILQREYDLTLTNGVVQINNLTPPLLLSKEARRHWYVTMSGAPASLKPLPSIVDLKNVPITGGTFYTVFNGQLVVYDAGGPTTGTDVQLVGNYVPLISDPAFDDSTGELGDNLITIGVALILEAGNPAEVIRQAEDVDSPTGMIPNQ